MTACERLVDDLDRSWTRDLPGRLTFRVLGSTAPFLQTSFERDTRDADVLEVASDGLTAPVAAALRELTGLGARSRDGIGCTSISSRTTSHILRRRPSGTGFSRRWQHVDVLVLDVDWALETRVGPLLQDLGCEKVRVRTGGERTWQWRPPGHAP